MENKILITYFEPFGGDGFNASGVVAECIPQSLGAEKLMLPVEFERGAMLAIEKARELSARFIVCFGEARARKAVTPELVAINLNHASIPDNAGKAPRDEVIVNGGAAAYFTVFPARRLAERINELGVRASLSYSAGAYVCNDLYYRLLHEFEGSETKVVFIHVPRDDGENAYKNMALAVAQALSELIFEETNG